MEKLDSDDSDEEGIDQFLKKNFCELKDEINKYAQDVPHLLVNPQKTFPTHQKI